MSYKPGHQPSKTLKNEYSIVFKNTFVVENGKVPRIQQIVLLDMSFNNWVILFINSDIHEL